MSLKLVLAKLSSQDPEERGAAVVTLARSRDLRAIPYLRQVADEDPESELRYLARKAMIFVANGTTAGAVPGGAPGPAPAPVPGPAPARPEEPKLPGLATLAADLEAPDKEVRLAAAKAAAKVQSETLAELLSDRLRHEDDPQVVATLLAGVAARGDETCVDAVVPWLKNLDPRIRANAVEALGALGSEKGFVYLMDHLRDPDNRCRANAVLALRKSGRANVYKTLETMIRSESASMQDSATYCLGQMGQGPEVFALLVLGLKSAFTVTRNQARAVLRKLAERGVDRAAEFLRRVGEADEAEAAEDLFAKAKLVAPAADVPREDAGDRAARLRQEIEALGTPGLAPAPPGPDRAAERAERLLCLKDLVPERSAPEEDPVAARLAALATLPPGDRPGASRADALVASLQALAGLKGGGENPRQAREARLRERLESLAS